MVTPPTSFLSRVLSFKFRLLYHSFAWSYDTIAWLASFGRWRDWTQVVFRVLENTGEAPVVELGFGPGHLQKEMIRRGIPCLGVDESRQMCGLALRRIKSIPFQSGIKGLIRARAEDIPLAPGSAAAIIATFPAEYIFHEATLNSCSRVLQRGGQIIFLLSAQPGGFSPLDITLRFLYRITKQDFQYLAYPEDYLNRIRASNFDAQILKLPHKKDKLWLICGHKV